ncbi:hypothetical protein FNF29_03882 [Cafeteria roenbergensis]|uniref:Uncharacterized protein n=1 Tax=Cafeteria roenbergensis TaxID=33653 RepID=A0A5A8CH48_CAFRO|nr:hypothetical protein FNF29_03882 [Cafeteria roenbergensis]KAA0167761.1 hypothetical protein FNF31_00696 [Cafeteria roenbergensis]|eukprot:KAA0152316.1 hypothetical protein FNF29_03882 [Cafeteria roenbergensis]
MRRPHVAHRAGATAGPSGPDGPSSKHHGKRSSGWLKYILPVAAVGTVMLLIMMFMPKTRKSVPVYQEPVNDLLDQPAISPEAASPIPSLPPFAVAPLVLDPKEVLVVSEQDEPGALEAAWETLGDPRSKPNLADGVLRMPAGIGSRLDALAEKLRPRVDRLLLEGQANQYGLPVGNIHFGKDGGSVLSEEGDGTIDNPHLAKSSEPGLWDTELIDEFSVRYPSEALWFAEMLSVMRALRVTRLLRGGLSSQELATALTKPKNDLEERASAKLRKRARGAAVISFGVQEDLMLWAEANPGGLVVAVDAEQWWGETNARASQDFMSACEEARVCCAVARVPWHTTQSKDGDPSNIGKQAMVLGGVVEATKDGFKDLHVGAAQAEKECLRWTEGQDGSLPWTFDIAIVRAPHGYNAASPGRMASIATAAALLRPGGHVFVRDVQRDLEHEWTAGYFGSVPRAALPPKGQDAVKATIDTMGDVHMPRSPGVPESIPAVAGSPQSWTAAGVDAFAGTPDEAFPVGKYPFLGMAEKLAHFRVPGRVPSKG